MKRGRTWSYGLYLGRDADWKREEWVGGFRTRKDAEAAAAKERPRLRRQVRDAADVTVREHLEEMFDDIHPSLEVKRDCVRRRRHPALTSASIPVLQRPE